MLAAIKGAKKTITFETYIYWSGKVGQEFAAALDDELARTHFRAPGLTFVSAHTGDVASNAPSTRRAVGRSGPSGRVPAACTPTILRIGPRSRPCTGNSNA